MPRPVSWFLSILLCISVLGWLGESFLVGKSLGVIPKAKLTANPSSKLRFGASIDCDGTDFIKCLLDSSVISKDISLRGSYQTPEFPKGRAINPSELPLKKTRIAAYLSHMSYFSKKRLSLDSRPEVKAIMDDQLEGFPMELEASPVYGTSVHVWISKSTRTAFVCFPGTRTVTDLYHDLDTRSVPMNSDNPADSKIHVHAGFRNKYLSVHQMIEDVLSLHDTYYDTIVATGHSLGGALATIACPVIAEAFPDKRIECMTFGAPRAGNEHFVEWFKSKVSSNLRFVNSKDPVPSLPFSGRFHHTVDATMMKSIGGGKLTQIPDNPVGTRFLRAVQNIELSQIMKEHDLDTYIDRLNKFIN